MVVPGVVRRVIKAFPTLIQAVALVALLHLLGQVGTMVYTKYLNLAEVVFFLANFSVHNLSMNKKFISSGNTRRELKT